MREGGRSVAFILTVWIRAGIGLAGSVVAGSSLLGGVFRRHPRTTPWIRRRRGARVTRQHRAATGVRPRWPIRRLRHGVGVSGRVRPLQRLMTPHQGRSGAGAGEGRLDVTISGHISYESSTIGDAMKTRFQRRLRRIDTAEDHTNGQGSTLGDSRGEQDQGDVEETGSGRFGHLADSAAEPTTRVDASSTGRDVDEPRQRLDGPARPTFGDEGRRQGGDHPATGLGTEASHPNDGRTLSSPGDHHDDSGFDGRALPATNDEDVRHLDASSEAPAHRTASSPSAIAVADTNTRVDDAHTQRVQTVRDRRAGRSSSGRRCQPPRTVSDAPNLNRFTQSVESGVAVRRDTQPPICFPPKSRRGADST